MALTVGGTAKENRPIKVKRSKTVNPVTQLHLGSSETGGVSKG